MNPFLCIHSLTAHGSVGLKAFITTLGEHCLPVPSLLLTGPGDMPGCRRFDYDFESLLRGTLTAAVERGERLTVFVGYLAHAEQIQIIVRALDDFRAAVSSLWVDPVCGDHGRAYVSEGLIAAWPQLLTRAAWAFPNATELDLLAGSSGDAAPAVLRTLFPRVNFIVTGQPRGDELETRLLRPDVADHIYRQPLIPGRFSGTGDLFAATFARALLIDGLAPEAAIETSGNTVADAIHRSLRQGISALSLR